MNRRRFFKALGVLSAATVVAPVALAEIRFAEDPHPWNGGWEAHTVPTHDLFTGEMGSWRGVSIINTGYDPRPQRVTIERLLSNREFFMGGLCL